ncbi:MAG: PBP1A family penicillin-binding protein [Candidatus Pacebacteria bacterium]|nr:PBP1A family penicillin-binding protein [Candidatus Paceibacterota bacterium]
MANWKRAWKKRIRKLKKKVGPGQSFKKARLVFRPSKFFARLAVLGFLSVLLAILAVGLVFAWYAKDLPSPDKIVRREGFSTKIFDRHNQLLYEIFADQKRVPVKFEQVPLALQQATIAIEDKNFYQHQGFDPLGMIRAAYKIIVYRRLQGGSTLTQQLVKNVLLTQKRVLSRKIKEFILAIQIESRYSKDEILTMYLNEAPYGGTAWGVEAASQTYFGKNTTDLNLVESAILAGLPQRPSYYSPFSSEPQAYLGRTRVVLKRMREDGYLSKQQEQDALAELEKIRFVKEKTDLKAPHFVMYVKSQLEERYGQRMVEQGGLRVQTTLDLELQEKAQEIIAEEIGKVEFLNITNGAAVVMNPQSGEILAMVGSKDYFDPDYDGKVNVTLALRQPGSAIKPVTYVTAFKKNYTASTLLMDAKTIFPIGFGQPDYEPENYDGKFRGPVQIRFALGSSLNVPAVKMLAMVGIKPMLATAAELGLSTLEPNPENLSRLGLAVTLGGGEVRLLDLAEAYSSFANGGLKVEPLAILEVADQEGKILEKNQPRTRQRVLSESEAFLINHILADNQARSLTFSSNSALNITDRQVAVKTGTTNDKRDNWTIGWTPELLVGVWVGNNDNSQMKKVASGVSGAAPIWRQIILLGLEEKPATTFKIPEGIISAEIDAVSGYRAHDGYPGRLEYFIKGTEPVGEDPVHAKLKLCRGQNKLATIVDVARGHYEEKEFFVFTESDPVSSDGINRWQAGIDQWLAGQSDERYYPPKEYCQQEGDIEINLITPADRIQINSNEIEIKARAISIKRINQIEVFINGSLRESFKGDRFDKIFTLADDTYVIKVEAEDEDGRRGSKDVRIGVNRPWDWQPSPTPEPTPLPTATPTLVPSPTPGSLPTSLPTP